jgi:YesN/AraC family two-component response regulator
MMPDWKVLCVDDEIHILSSLRRLLFMEDYELLTANNEDEALELLEKHEIQLVISDYRMPEINGVRLLQKVKEKYPETVRVILSGYVDVDIIVEAINKGEVYRFITKPWNDDELKASILQCLEHYEIIRKNSELLKKVEEQNEELTKVNDLLESIVNERTFSLKLSQDILQQLPMPVIGVDKEWHLIIYNDKATDCFEGLNQVMLGTDARSVFPQELSGFLEASMNSIEEQNKKLKWGEQSFDVTIERLKNKDEFRGCILVFTKE